MLNEETKYLKLQKLKNGYEYKESNDAALETLNYFLDDCHAATNSFKKWMYDPAIEIFGGNVTTVEKEGEKIIITLEFVENEKKYDYSFETTREKLIDIMDRWNELYKKMPEKIIITRYNDAIILEGKN
ncbi:MAG: hypothetical protein WCD44_00545 [Candidatus Babeliales bacterium]